MTPRSTTVALIGSDSLMGREIRDILATSVTGVDLRLIAAEDEQAGTLTRVGDEPSLVIELNAEGLADASIVMLAGSAASSRKTLELLGENAEAAVIDLTNTAEEQPEARLRAPQVESEVEADGDSPGAVYAIAHPAAIALALFLRRLQANDAIRRSVITVFGPASEHGTAAVEELQQQTVSLLSFKGLPQSVFDTQLAFSMLPKYGEEARVRLEDTEGLIERHLVSLLALPGDGEGAPLPSLRLIQAPVFHGYSFSAWVEFENSPGVEAVEGSLAMDAIEVRGAEGEPPTNVSQAGQGGITVGAIAADRNEPEACWFWLVADNLRVAAENAVAVARQLL